MHTVVEYTIPLLFIHGSNFVMCRVWQYNFSLVSILQVTGGGLAVLC